VSQPRLIAQLRTGLHAYRQLGPTRGTATAARHVAAAGRGRVRAIQLARNPLRVSPAELSAALGERSPAEALSRAGEALPTVTSWRAELAGLDVTRRADLLRRADDIVAHRFDLLGSGPTDLGPEIDWHQDFKSGRRWPLDHICRVPVTYSDRSDVKVPWELSRFQHLPLLSAAHILTGERRYLDEIGAQITSWVDTNPVEFGVNWACTMDVAIRGVNWVAALALCAEAAADQPWLERAVASLLLHARFIRGHLEFGTARGNHYLSDVVGLLVIAGVFEGSEAGRGWARWAARELGSEFAHQVRPDGCDHEASTSYHRLVTELFIIGADAADRLAPDLLDSAVRAGIPRMLAFAADYTRPDGLAPQIGDADNGRILPLGDYASADQRSHLHLFSQARVSYRTATRSAAYPDGGFYILRAGELYAAVRCGDVGIYGRGCHAHNDVTAFELSWNTIPLVIDPGSYLYTADPAERNRFRSTAVHSALQVDGGEQNELRADRLFAMVDRTRAAVLAWEAGETATTLRCRHNGYESLRSPVAHTRTLRLHAETRTLEVVDEVMSATAHELSWCLPFAPCEVESTTGTVVARFPGVSLHVQAPGLTARVEEGWLSPSYGVRTPAPFLRLRGRSDPGEHHSRIVLRVEPL
jgi:Heparinase II/III-like protein/Heparinase II/III N-terminus